MAIAIQETFQIQAPIESVWRFFLDPDQVASCMPGAALDEVIDERTFKGNIRVKVGAITTSYEGRVTLTTVDEEAYAVEMVAEGRETSGGTAKGTMSSRLRSLAPGVTEVVAEANVDLTGRIMQVGRGMIQGVSHQLFQQFVTRVRERLEAPEGALVDAGRLEQDAIPIISIVLKTIWSAIIRFVRRLLGRETARS
jgi:carbon monoxide dehydrogenase subunit G